MPIEDVARPEALPLVADHLAKCDSCWEEFEALLEALRTIDPHQAPHPT